jgi:hypothetical protein
MLLLLVLHALTCLIASITISYICGMNPRLVMVYSRYCWKPAGPEWVCVAVMTVLCMLYRPL